MKEQLKKVLTVALEEKFPEVKNIIIIQNEYIENNFDCVLNIDYVDIRAVRHIQCTLKLTMLPMATEYNLMKAIDRSLLREMLQLRVPG